MIKLSHGVLFILLSLLTACAMTQVDENDPASVFSDIESDIRGDHYQIAIDKLRALRNKFPYSNQAVEAQLRIADVYYLQESYDEAISAYEIFRDLHPKHSKVAYALFRIAKSYFKSAPENVARDLASAQKAISAYQEFLARFPQSPDAAEARQDCVAAKNLLGKKELSIADFYFRRKNYQSAKNRYEKIIQLYPETEAAVSAQSQLERIQSL